MADFLNSAVIWFGIGFIFFMLEFVIPGFILFFFGIGAWLVAFAALFFNISINAQIILFISSSIVTVLLFRRWVRQKFGDIGVNTNRLEDEFVGKVAKAETSITPGQRGKVEFRGTSFEAISDEVIPAGENVIITETQSIILVVKSLKIK